MAFNSNNGLEAYGLPRTFGSSKHSKYKSYHHRKPKEYCKEAMDHFNKKYELTTKSSSYELPDSGTWYSHAKWQIERFQELKEKLNNVKSNLNHVHLKTWHQHTNFVNRSSKVVPSVKRLIRPQLGTQAWCKFHEIVHTYNIIPLHKSPLQSVHLCEAPGAFITSLNHYLKLNHPHVQWEWIANTLNPHHEGNSFDEMISDDRLILGTRPRWYFGPDNTGNIMRTDFPTHFIRHLNEIGHTSVSLVTADGSFNCQGNPGEQEVLVGKLHYREVQVALSLLQPGGNFLLKLFTVFESDTICMVYLLVCVFARVHLFKPGSSKEGNSEVYLICRGFKRDEAEKKNLCIGLEKAFDPLTKDKVMVALSDIPDEFLDTLYQGVLLFTEYQISAIQRNLTLFQQDIRSSPLECARLDKLQTEILELYMNRCRLKPIDDTMLLVPNLKNSVKQILTFDGRIENGAFQERLVKEDISLSRYVKEELAVIDTLCEDKPELRWIENLQAINYEASLTLVRGNTIHQVQNSIFCLARLFKLLYEIRRKEEAVCHRSSETGIEFLLSRLPSHGIPADATLTLDLSHLCDITTSSASTDQIHLLDLLIKHIATLPMQHSLLLVNVPVLTQFSVSAVVLLAGRLFEKVGFLLLHNVTPSRHSMHAILLSNLMSRNTEVLSTVATSCRNTMESSDNKQCIVSILPVNMLCDHPLLYKCLFDISCCVVKNHLLELIQQSESSPS